MFFHYFKYFLLFKMLSNTSYKYQNEKKCKDKNEKNVKLQRQKIYLSFFI